MFYMTGKTEMTRTGPNDVSGVVWAIGEFFLLFSISCFFFNILTKVLLTLYQIRDREDGDKENGAIGEFFMISFVFFFIY